MAKVILFLDFDGTCTRATGSKVTYSSFYADLLSERPTRSRSYSVIPPKSPTEVQRLLKEAFESNPDDPKLMTPEAVTFLHKMLAHKDVTVHIISRNTEWYIKALLKYQGFNDTEISKLTITGINAAVTWSDKQDYVVRTLQTFGQPDVVYVLDDDKGGRFYRDGSIDEGDYARMMHGVKEACPHLSPDYQKGYNCNPGEFAWATYEKDITALVDLAEKNTEEQARLATAISGMFDGSSTAVFTPPVAGQPSSMSSASGQSSSTTPTAAVPKPGNPFSAPTSAAASNPRPTSKAGNPSLKPVGIGSGNNFVETSIPADSPIGKIIKRLTEYKDSADGGKRPNRLPFFRKQQQEDNRKRTAETAMLLAQELGKNVALMENNGCLVNDVCKRELENIFNKNHIHLVREGVSNREGGNRSLGNVIRSKEFNTIVRDALALATGSDTTSRLRH